MSADTPDINLSEVPTGELMRELLARVDAACMVAVVINDDGSRTTKMRYAGGRHQILGLAVSMLDDLRAQERTFWSDAEKW